MDNELKTQVDKSLELTTKMLERTNGLEAQIKTLEEKGVGVSDLKEKVEKMADDNAKALDAIKAAAEAEAKRAADERLDEFEAKFGKQGNGREKIDGVPDEFLKSVTDMGRARERSKRVGHFSVEKAFKNRKAVTALAASGGDMLVGEYESGIVAPGEQPVTLLDLIPRSTTDQPIVYWVEETLASRTNNTTVRSIDKTGTGQGSALGESDFVFDQKSSEVRTIGHVAKVALQMLDDAPQVRAYLEGRMSYMLLYKLERQVLKGGGSGVNMTGINDGATAYDATLDSTVGVDALQNLDVLRLGILQVALQHTPATGIILNPYEVAGLELLKDSTGSYLFANPAGGNGIRPWGIPAVGTTQQTQDNFTIGDFAMSCELAMRKQVEAMVSTENEDDFEKLLATMRAYLRAVLKVYRPGSFITGTFTAAKA